MVIQSAATPYTMKLFMKRVDREAKFIILTVGISFLLRELILFFFPKSTVLNVISYMDFFNISLLGLEETLVAGHYCLPRGCVYFE
jgi:hypothetical protein